MTYTEPLLSVVLLLGFIGLLPLRRIPAARRSLRLLVAAIALLFMITWPVFDSVFAQLIEWPYHEPGPPRANAEAIVVLSSYVERPGAAMPVAMPDEMTYGRCAYAAWLYRNWKPVPILVTGGAGESGEPNAQTMAFLLQAAGVPPDRISREERSRNTHENAVFSAALLRQKGIRSIALVTDADSMLRAERCFRKEGLSVVPAPFGQRQLELTADEFIPSWKSIRRNERVLHEIGGLLWYKLRGWI